MDEKILLKQKKARDGRNLIDAVINSPTHQRSPEQRNVTFHDKIRLYTSITSLPPVLPCPHPYEYYP